MVEKLLVWALVLFAAMCTGGLLWTLVHLSDARREARQLRVDHHCVVTGFAGRSALTVFTCDDGVRVGEELDVRR